MAYIEPQYDHSGNFIHYRLFASNGYDYQGKQIRKTTMWWPPEKNMPKRKMKQQAMMAAYEFEKKLEQGYQVDDNQTFPDYAQYVMELKQRSGLAATTLERYQGLLRRINPAIGHGLAKIVDAILRAKGFTTYVSPAGPDKGVDILASAGTLGFGSPKICVHVKSSDAPVDRILLDQLGGVIKNFGAEYGLLVSWSGFKSSVINETAKRFFEIRLWTHKEIIQEFLRYYDQMDAEIRELIPLKKIWVVNTDDE